MTMTRIFLLSAILLLIIGAMPVLSAQVTRNYGDLTENGWYWLDGPGEQWDSTQCDLTISYQLDMSAYVPLMGTTAWSLVGVGGGTARGWMASGAPAAAETNPVSLDTADKFILGTVYGEHGTTYDETGYDATGPETLAAPPIGNPLLNCGIWFYRDGVDQATMCGMIDGRTYNTGGIYDVVITYHAIDPTLGTMFATVNGVQTGFYDALGNGPPNNYYYPLGKSLKGTVDRLYLIADIWGDNVKVYNLTAQGCPYYTSVGIDIKPGSYPNSINLGSKGVVPVAVLGAESFDPATIDPTTVNFAGTSPVHWALEDVNHDGHRDMILHFDTQLLNLTADSTEATLTGDTTDERNIMGHITGADSVNIVPKKRKGK